MKYVMEIPPKADFVTAYYMEDGLPVMYKSDRIDDLEPYTEPDRKAIEDEVWEFVRTCLMMDGSDFVEIFDSYSYINLLEYSYRIAKARYEAWLKQKDEIHVGDEVANLTDYKGVVVKIYDDKTVNIMWDNGNVVNCKTNTFHKTGRHFDEVAELLKKMRGDSDGTET